MTLKPRLVTQAGLVTLANPVDRELWEKSPT